jgi:hypothetical protein
VWPCSQWRTISLATGCSRRNVRHSSQTIVVEMNLLARQRRAATVRALLAIRFECADAAPQQQPLELLDMGHRRGHLHSDFAAPGAPPARASPRAFACKSSWVDT